MDCSGSVFIILVEASERPAVACSEWLDLGRAIQFSHVPFFSAPLDPESETAESKKTRKHENAACYERHLPDGIAPTEEYTGKTDDETDNADANV